MQTSRRGFMGFIGTLPVIGPSLVKDAANLSGLNIGAVKIGTDALIDCDIDDSYKKYKADYPSKSGAEKLLKFKKINQWFKKNGLPPFHKEQWYTRYHCQMLDVDLAANRSMSLVAKMHQQRERDWKKYENNMLNQSSARIQVLENIFNNKMHKDLNNNKEYYEKASLNSVSSFDDDC